MSQSEPIVPARSISGRAVVIAMFVFAGTATSFMYFYWNKHIEPFMPLQLALAEEFEHSSPRVEGGQRKMWKGTPRILRVTMRVPFNPTDEGKETLARERIQGIAGVAKDYVKLSDYEILTVHFYFEDKEDSLKTATFETPIEKLNDDGG